MFFLVKYFQSCLQFAKYTLKEEVALPLEIKLESGKHSSLLLPMKKTSLVRSTPAVGDVDVPGAIPDVESGHVVVPADYTVVDVDRTVHPFNLAPIFMKLFTSVIYNCLP